LAKLHCALLAQFGPEQVKYNIEQDGELTVKELDKSILFKNDIIWQAKRRSVTLSPEFALQRLGGLIQVYAQLLPLLTQQDTKAIELWNRMVIASAEPQKEKLMIQIQQTLPGQAPPGNPIEQMLKAQGGGIPNIPQTAMSTSPNSPLNKLNNG
jgi:hypothetical protein